MTITVIRTGSNLDPASIHFATSDGTAAAPAEYTNTSGDVQFAAGEMSTTFTVPIINDSEGTQEPSENFNVTLSSPSAGSTLGAPASAVVTINTAGPIPTLGTFGKLLLAMTTMMTGLFALSRKRIFGLLLTAALVGAMAATSASAQMRPHAQTTAKHSESSKRSQKSDGSVLSAVASKGGTLQLTLSGGQSLSLPQTHMRVVDLRTPHRHKVVDVSALKPGMNVEVIVHTEKNGQIGRVKVKILS